MFDKTTLFSSIPMCLRVAWIKAPCYDIVSDFEMPEVDEIAHQEILEIQERIRYESENRKIRKKVGWPKG